MRACVVGGGLAGSLLAWRLAQRLDVHVDLVLGRHQDADATQASGGAVRAYEPSAQARRLAIASLRELLGSRVLLQWSDYRQTGFVYLRETDAGLAAEAEEIDRELPGSVELLPASPAAGSRSLGWSRFPGRIAVLERQAGYISPAELRRAILTDLAGRPGATVRAAVLDALEPTGTGDTARATVDGSRARRKAGVMSALSLENSFMIPNGSAGVTPSVSRSANGTQAGWKRLFHPRTQPMEPPCPTPAHAATGSPAACGAVHAISGVTIRRTDCELFSGPSTVSPGSTTRRWRQPWAQGRWRPGRLSRGRTP